MVIPQPKLGRPPVLHSQNGCREKENGIITPAVSAIAATVYDTPIPLPSPSSSYSLHKQPRSREIRPPSLSIFLSLALISSLLNF